MVDLSLSGEQEEPRERARASVDEMVSRLHETTKAKHASGNWSSKPEKSR